MKLNARKLLAVILVLAMLLSYVAVAEDGLTELGMDQPIEIEGEVGTDGDTQGQEGELEIDMDEAEGLPDGEVDPEGGEELDLTLDLDGEALETGEEELAPVTEAAMNATGDGTSAATAFEIGDWNTLRTAMSNSPGELKRTGLENAQNPTYYKLTGNATSSGGGGLDNCIRVGGDRYVELDLNGKTIDRNRSDSSADDYGFVFEVRGSLTIRDTGGTGTIKGGYGYQGGGVYVAYRSASSGTQHASFTMYGGTITGNKAHANYGGGGVYSNGGPFTMYGGKIIGNTTDGKGGGVYLSESTFTMEGGTISGNTTTNNGGGVYVSGGTFQHEGRHHRRR